MFSLTEHYFYPAYKWYNANTFLQEKNTLFKVSQFHLFMSHWNFRLEALASFFSIAVASEREVVVISINSHGKTHITKIIRFVLIYNTLVRSHLELY